MTMTELSGKKVQVYYNLHRHCLSIKLRGRVVAHVSEIRLQDAQYRVSTAGRARVLRTKRKNVHAVVTGKVVPMVLPPTPVRQDCTYNPYRYSAFVTRSTETPIFQSDYAHIQGKRITAKWMANND